MNAEECLWVSEGSEILYSIGKFEGRLTGLFTDSEIRTETEVMRKAALLFKPARVVGIVLSMIVLES